MTSRRFFTASALALLFAVPHRASAQDSDGNPCVDYSTDRHCATQQLRMGSAAVGYGTSSITDLGSVADREMTGVNLHYDLHLLSLLLHGLPVLTYDAVTLDMTWGRMSSKPLQDNIGPEDNSALPWVVGYQFLAGKDLGGIVVLGGLGWQSFTYSIGGSTLDGSTRPLIARVEVGGRRRLVLTGMKSISGNESQGARIDVPFFRRLNLTAQYSSVSGRVDLFNNTPRDAKARSILLGVRSAELR